MNKQLDARLVSAQTDLMDRWMICDFMVLSTAFRSYQADGREIMKG